MQPPIPAETILQDRYRLIKVLGQGGFARTYLAEDQGRFKERCALKEFIPSQTNTLLLEKSKQLFQREATILYQIQHPQIPQFQSTFEYTSETGSRLFLVQDYVEGKTYRELLQERKSQQQTFSETEARNLMQQMLPVLDHIHSKGIIHRDISPDNLILRLGDRRPVLIDFGVVKEIATQLQQLEDPDQGTAVGKLGFAPNEQFQTGRAYPSSDLYSLAVTSLVLMTGQEPQNLFEDETATWHWQEWTAMSPGFAQVLERMLAYRPSDRFQSASDVEAALQALPGSTASATKKMPSQAAASANVSQLRTMAVERPGAVLPRPAPREAVIPKPRIRQPTSIWDSPWVVISIGLLLALVVGVASWAFVRTLQQRMVSKPTPSTVVTPTPTPIQPVSTTRSLFLLPGDQLSVQGTLQPNETVNYVFQGQEGQPFKAFLNGQGVVMSVLGGPQRQLLDSQAQQVSSWEGILPSTGDYILQLQALPGLSQGNFLLTVNLGSLEPPTPSPSPIVTPDLFPTPEASPEVEAETRRVRFPAGESSQQISATTTPSRIKRYLVRAREGQILTTQVQDGAVTLNIRYPDGALVEGAGNVLNWEFLLPVAGSYQVDVVPVRQESRFTLDIGVRNSRQ